MGLTLTLTLTLTMLPILLLPCLFLPSLSQEDPFPGLQVGQVRIERMERIIREMKDRMDQQENTLSEMKNILDKQENTINELNNKLYEQEKTVNEHKKKLDDQEKAVVSSVSSEDYILVCAYQDLWEEKGSRISFDSLSTSVGVGGEMDVDTGVFTALTPGHYMVTWSALARVDSHREVDFKLMVNGEEVEGSGWWSYSQDGSVGDQGSRTVYLHLSPGDTVYLYADGYRVLTGSIQHLTLCVSLVTVEI